MSVDFVSATSFEISLKKWTNPHLHRNLLSAPHTPISMDFALEAILAKSPNDKNHYRKHHYRPYSVDHSVLSVIGNDRTRLALGK